MGPRVWLLMRISAVRIRRMSGWGGAVAARVSSPRAPGLEVEGLEGFAGLPAVGDEKTGFEADGAFGVVSEEEAVGTGFAGVYGAQIGDEAGPPEVDAFVGRIVQQVANDALLAVDEVAVFQRAPRVPGNELAMSRADQVGLLRGP